MRRAMSTRTVWKTSGRYLKRGIKGTYVSIEPFHLFRYLDEQAFRFNERKDKDAGRFVKVVRGIIGKGLRYAKLTGKVDGDGLPFPPTPWTFQTLKIDLGVLNPNEEKRYFFTRQAADEMPLMKMNFGWMDG